jgi:hypothetical protein
MDDRAQGSREARAMTLDEARNAVGRAVVYEYSPGRFDEGVITSTNDQFAFVRYGAQQTSQATRPQDLRLAGR